MFADAWPYQLKFFLSCLIFLVTGVWAISVQEPLLMLIPFIWIGLPTVFNWLVTQSGQLFWLVLIMLPLSTELQLTPVLGLDFPDEPLLILLTGMVLVKIIHQPRWLPEYVLSDPLSFILAIYFLWIFICCMYSMEPWLSFKYLLAKTWYILPFVVLPQVMLTSRSRLQKMALCLLIPVTGVVIQTLVRHAFYGFQFEHVWKTMAPFFRNHVNYSSMLVCLLPVGWCIWKLTPAENPYRNWIAAGLITGMAGLLFSYSRGAWIALLAGICVVWVISKKLLPALLLVAIFAIILASAWLVTGRNFMRFTPDHDHTVFHTDFSEHMQATVNLKDVSTAERFYRWVAGARMLAEKPVTGFGPNAFYLHYRPYTLKPFETCKQ